jgi:hypothetical protein
MGKEKRSKLEALGVWNWVRKNMNAKKKLCKIK